MLTRGRCGVLAGVSGAAVFAAFGAAAAVLLPQPEHRAVGRLPLIFVDGARQEAQDAGALGRDAAADHLGDRSGDHDAGQARSSV